MYAGKGEGTYMFQLEIPIEIKVLAGISCAAEGMLFFTVFYRLISMSFHYQWIRDSWKRILESTQNVQDRRIQNYRKTVSEYGAQEHIPKLQKWDRYFTQSGIRQRIPFLNSQLYLLFFLLGAAAGFFIFLFTSPEDMAAGMVKGVLWMISELTTGYMIIKVLRIRRKRNTEKELLPFLNVVDNFSKGDQDLFHILENAGNYLNEPLRSAVLECSRHASGTGKRYEAIQELIYRIEHPKFQEIMHNLDICSRNEANYSEVLGDMRDSLMNYLSNRRETDNILREGKIQILLIIFMGMPMIGMLSGITGISLLSMSGNFFGRIVICYWVLLLLFISYQMFFAEDRKDSI